MSRINVSNKILQLKEERRVNYRTLSRFCRKSFQFSSAEAGGITGEEVL